LQKRYAELIDRKKIIVYSEEQEIAGYIITDEKEWKIKILF